MKNSIVIAFCALLLPGCNKEEPIPAYLKLNPFVVDEPGGAAEHKLPHAFVYLFPNVLLGGFPVPGLIPVLAQGDTTIQVFAGIRENGSRRTPTQYPLMESYVTKVTLVPGQIVEITPVTRYRDNVVIATGSEEDFDGASVLPFDDKDGNTNTTMTFSSVDAFSGRYGLLTIDTANSINWIAFRQELENLPTTGGRPVFLELHYKNTNPFQLLLLGSDATGINTEQIPVFEFNKSEDWNKIYINLTSFLSSSRYAKYQLQFRAALERDAATGKFVRDSGVVCLDNLRVVYF